jgi:hypothetical protein
MHSNGMTYMNGVMSQYRSVSYVLKPITTGKLYVPGAVAIINGREMRSNAVVLDVRKSSSGRSSPPPTAFSPWPEPQVEEEYIMKPGESLAEKIKNNIIVKTEVNKTTCYEGEPVMATFKLCSRLRSESKVVKRPSLNGFSVYDMVETESNIPTVETINGKPYNVHLIRKTQLFPLQSGTFVIDPVELDNKVRFLHQAERGSNSDDMPRSPLQQMMDDFMDQRTQGEVEEHSFNLSSKPVTVTVKPLPVENKPAGFNGAVGNFTIAAALDEPVVPAGKAFHLKISIRGQGNFMVINPPLIRLSPGMESYDPAIQENVDKTVYPLGGSKTFDYTFVAHDTGIYQIPPVAFTYFDPAESKYKTARSDSFNIRVSAPNKKSAVRRFISADPSALQSHWIDAISVQSLMFYITLILAGAIVLYQWTKYREQKKIKARNQLVTAANTVEAAQQTKADPLEEARSLLNEGKSQQFYSEVNRVVWNKISERTNIAATELNKYNIVLHLERMGKDEETIRDLKYILNACELALYTPVHETEDMIQVLAKTGIVLKEL